MDLSRWPEPALADHPGDEFSLLDAKHEERMRRRRAKVREDELLRQAMEEEAAKARAEAARLAAEEESRLRAAEVTKGKVSIRTECSIDHLGSY
jgi:hypothetical protein